MLFIVGIRSCLSVFQLYSFSSSAFALVLELVAISFGYYVWSKSATKAKRKIGESLVASFYSVWKSKKDVAGYGNNTNSEFAEFLLHRKNSVSSPRNGNSNKRRREEICLELDLELDDVSSGSGSSKFLAIDCSGQCSHFIINNARCITVNDKGS